MSEANFHKLYPSQEGYSYFLIAAPAAAQRQGQGTARNRPSSHGFHVTPTAQRLEAYLAVENTYLSTFQALGGLGLLLGALGLAVVLLRSAWERRGELALMRALGFRAADARLAGAGGKRLPAAARPRRRRRSGAAGGGAADVRQRCRGAVAATAGAARPGAARRSGRGAAAMAATRARTAAAGAAARMMVRMCRLAASRSGARTYRLHWDTIRVRRASRLNGMVHLLEEIVSMSDKYSWLLYVALAGLAWGTYVPHHLLRRQRTRRQTQRPPHGHPLRRRRYFVIGVLLPLALFTDRPISTGRRSTLHGSDLLQPGRRRRRRRRHLRHLRHAGSAMKSAADSGCRRRPTSVHRAADLRPGPGDQHAGQRRLAPPEGRAVALRLQDAAPAALGRHPPRRRWRRPGALLQGVVGKPPQSARPRRSNGGSPKRRRRRRSPKQ